VDRRVNTSAQRRLAADGGACKDSMPPRLKPRVRRNSGESMTTTPVAPPSVFRTPQGAVRFVAAYDAAVARCAAAVGGVYVPTSFGMTHAITSGDRSAMPLVLLHCGMGSASVWHPNLEELSRHFRVFAVDVICEPNKSVPSRTVRTRNEFARWLVEVLDGLSVESAAIVGSSYGGFLATNFAVHAPDRVKGLVLISPAATFVPVWRFFLRALLLYLRRPDVRGPIMLRGMEIDPTSPWAEVLRLAASEGRIVHRVAPVAIPRQDLQRVGRPVLLLIGERDRLYRPKTPQQVLERARQLMPQLEGEIIPNCNHLAALTHSQYVNGRISRFFRHIE